MQRSTSIIFCFLLFLSSCSSYKTLHIYNLDKTKCITVINKRNIRYIVNGFCHQIPDTNFVQIDVQKIDPLGDALHICWSGIHEWEAVVHNSIILKNKLDTARFSFSVSLPIDKYGVPNEKKFRQEDCAVFDFYRMKLSPDKGAIIEY